MINRWMQAHKTALIGIGAAAGGAMMAIIQNSPALSAELGEVRLGFSLLAMTIGQDLSPALNGIGETALDLADSYRELPDPVRTVISAFIGIVTVVGLLAGAAAALETIISGTLVASALSKLGGALAGIVSGSLAVAGAIGFLIGMIGVWILKVTGVLGFVNSLGSGLRSLIGGPLADFILTLLTLTGVFPLLAALGGAVIGFIEGGFSGAIEGAKEVLGTLLGSVVRTFTNIVDWIGAKGVSLIINVLTADYIGAIKDAFWILYDWLIGGSFIPEMFNAVVDWIGNAGVNLITGAVDMVTGAIQSAFTALDPRRWGSDLINGAVGGIQSALSAANPARWGRDLMSELGDGIKNGVGKVADAAEGAVDTISGLVGFDNIQNDRMARRWGSDLMQEFAKGVDKKKRVVGKSMPSPGGITGLANAGGEIASAGGGGGGGGTDIEIVFEDGAIRMSATGDTGTDIDRLVRRIKEELGREFGGRSNL